MEYQAQAVDTQMVHKECKCGNNFLILPKQWQFDQQSQEWANQQVESAAQASYPFQIAYTDTEAVTCNRCGTVHEPPFSEKGNMNERYYKIQTEPSYWELQMKSLLLKAEQDRIKEQARIDSKG